MINDKRFEEIVEQRFKKCKETLLAKSKEYSGENDRLHNFHVAAALEHCDTKQALFGMMTKHIVSIADMCTSGKTYPDDVWDEKLGDLINYGLLMDAARFEENETALFEAVDKYAWEQKV